MLKPLRKIKGIFTSQLIPQTIFLFAWFLLSGVCHAQTQPQIQVRVFMEGLLKPIPEMVRVEAGTFNIGTEELVGPQNSIWNNGAIETDDGHNFEGECDIQDCSKPLINILQSFEVGKHEITREQFKFFLNSATRESISPHSVWNDPEYYARNTDHPATYVSWDDAQKYVRWLSAETGQEYRLLSESEWEYVARAGTTSLYSFGDTIRKDQANFNSVGTVPVGSYPANDFGLHDVHGNVWEWVEDCWHQSYNDLPTDGSAWDTSCEGTDTESVLRGGAWDSATPLLLRSAQRGLGSETRHFDNVGFRIARTLKPRLTIASPQPDTNIMLLHGGVSGSTQVQVVINIAMRSPGTLILKSDDESVVSVSIDDAQIKSPVGSTQTTVKFMLTAQGPGNTRVTISVVDDQGVTNEVKIGVEVGSIYPEMVMVEEGEYMMGSTEGDIARFNAGDEGPQHLVTIPGRFEVSRYEVTRGQFAAFADIAGYSTEDNDCDWENPPDLAQDDNHPVVCVSWDDAQAYLEWLSEQTNQEYRLLSESEWEYVTRAGTTSTYYFGDTLSREDANYSSDGTVPVTSPDYSANGFGLYHVHGNVEEWVQDCWHANYEGAPTDGSAWEDSCFVNADRRVVRGGSWDDGATDLRSASRGFDDKVERYETLGFRIAHSPLTIASPRDTGIRLTLGVSPTTQVQVVIKESDTTIPARMTLQLDSGGESVVSISTTSIVIAPTVSKQRTAEFMLTAQNVGNTVLTIVVRNELGNQDQIKIPLEAESVFPEMLSISAGTFMMGASDGTRGDADWPQHQVDIVSAFEVGRYEITRRQFEVFVDDTDYTSNARLCSWRDPGFPQGDNHPVVCVTWDDAQAYVEWLSDKTNQEYRLLSESEWEYVARAGTTTTYSIRTNTGYGSNTITTSDANYGFFTHSGTVAVGSYSENAFGLYDVHGNVWEWVEDCWHNSYDPFEPVNGQSDAPANGEPWLSGGCSLRVVRGGSWINTDASDLRSAHRAPGTVTAVDNGFRVARTLSSP